MVDITWLVRELALKLNVPESEIKHDVAYFPFVLAIRNPVAKCGKGSAIGCFFLKLDDVSELYEDCGWEKIEDEMDVAVFSCLSQTEIFDYFYDWHPSELADARVGIDDYVKNHTPIITQKNNLFNYFTKK